MADFDFGNLLYLLAIILFAIFGSRKKKKPATASPYETVPEKDREPGILERLFSEEIYQPQPEYVPQESELDWRQKVKYDSPYTSEVYETEKVEAEVLPNSYIRSAYRRQDDERDESTNVVPAPNPFMEMVGEPFDLRKAVIYSEIINRRPF